MSYSFYTIFFYSFLYFFTFRVPPKFVSFQRETSVKENSIPLISPQINDEVLPPISQTIILQPTLTVTTPFISKTFREVSIYMYKL